MVVLRACLREEGRKKKPVYRRARVRQQGERRSKQRRSGLKPEQAIGTSVSSSEREGTHGVVDFAGSRWLCIHGRVLGGR